MADISQLCELLHGSSLIPVYFYQGGQLLDCWPKHDPLFAPPAQIINQLISQQKNITHTSTIIHSFYGLIRLATPDSLIVLGPVNSVPYADKDIFQLRKAYGIPESLKENYEIFLRRIPILHEDIFVYNLILANLTLQGEYIGIGEYYGREIDPSHNAIFNDFAKTEIHLRETEQIDMSYELSEEVYELIEKGDLDSLMQYSEHPPDFQIGVFSNNALRQFKTIFIIVVSQVSRVAIKGGVPIQTSLALMNAYIQAADTLDQISKVNDLMLKAIVDFTKRVAEVRHPKNLSAPINSCIQFINENVTKHITVEDVTKQAGFSRSYLTHRFKKETGTGLKEYIVLTKLEMAQKLLRTTDWSLSKISSYLEFSSQSHFQRVYKNHFKTTPLNYRQKK